MENGQVLSNDEKADHVINLCQWAVEYIKRGWVVIPCFLYRDSEGKKQPVFHFQWSTLDREAYNVSYFKNLCRNFNKKEKWFTALYLLTRQSNVVVVDRDAESARILTDRLGVSSVCSNTPKAPGSHAWFAGDDSIPRYVNQILHYDVPGGIFVPPSIVLDQVGSISGIYSWPENITLETISGVSLPVLPYTLKSFVLAGRPHSMKIDPDKYKDWKPSKEYIMSLLNDESIGKGQRHLHILKIAGMLQRVDQTREQIEGILRQLCKKRGWWDKQKDISGIIDWIFVQNKKSPEQVSKPVSAISAPSVPVQDQATEAPLQPLEPISPTRICRSSDNEMLTADEFRIELAAMLKRNSKNVPIGHSFRIPD